MLRAMSGRLRYKTCMPVVIHSAPIRTMERTYMISIQKPKRRRALASGTAAIALLAGLSTATAQQPKTAGGSGDSKQQVTTDTGKPIGSDEKSMTSGPEGPTLLQHFYLLEKLAHFDRERIPERVVHARGAGTHGEFVCAEDLSGLTKAAFLSAKGQKTPVFVRFSSVILPKGSAETARDVRGFAVKFYTGEGNYDLVGIDIPVFFIRDGIKFPDLVHALKPSPVTNVQESERYFDFFSALPETTNMLTYLFSDMGTPASYRMMDGFGIHAFKWINAKGEIHYVKYHFKSLQGLKNYTADEARKAGGIEPAVLTKDLHDAIEAKQYPSWDLEVQVLTPESIKASTIDPLDATKLWPESMAPSRTIGRLTLNRWPDNYFESTEQVAFNTGAYVPGIEPSEDRVLQSRNFSYSDSERHRLGPNYQQLPVNQPTRPVANDNQDGLADHAMRKGDINYNPSTKRPDRLVADPRYKQMGTKFHYDEVWKSKDNDPQDFTQAGDHYRAMTQTEKDHLVQNLTEDFKKIKDRTIVAKQVANFAKADADLGQKLAEANGVTLVQPKAASR